MYSKIVKDYFENSINLGIIEDADAIGIIENEICSDIIKMYIKVDKQNKSIIKTENKAGVVIWKENISSLLLALFYLLL